MYDRFPYLFASEPRPGLLGVEWLPGGTSLQAPFRSLGLPLDLRSLARQPRLGRITESIVRLKKFIARVVPPDETTIPLRIDSSSPWLAALPWEYAAGNLTVLRMSRFSLPPTMQKVDHTALLSSSETIAPTFVQEAILRWSEEVPYGILSHLSGDVS